VVPSGAANKPISAFSCMNYLTTYSRKARLALSRRKGVALIVVLSILLLLCGLVLSFFVSVTSESTASRLGERGGRLNELTDTVTSVVMSQIRDATTQGSAVAWASQPGMIRTYGTTSGTTPAASSSPLRYFKLYSAQNMTWTPSGSPYDPQGDAPVDWNSTPALYTDLNRPIADANGQLQYPIVTPPSVFTVAGTAPAGFTIDTVNGPSLGATPTIPGNEARMPVRWIYMLQNGKMSSPTSGNATSATWPAGGADSPSPENPIIGRIAFWTDDETAKVNINTAAGDLWTNTNSPDGYVNPGSYWDAPRVTTKFDRGALANFQPVQREYQRYPGHPATTYLSAVMPSLTRAQIGDIIPRVTTGGSLGGTALVTAGTAPFSTDNDRLYASVDELAFVPARAAQPGFSVQDIQQRRFFMTTNSRAPETTLYNTPRISIWPVHADASTSISPPTRTPFDRLIAFCSRTPNGGGKNYFFTRRNSKSPVDDFNSTDAGALRNRELYKYLQELTDRDVPGFGGKFSLKYSVDRNQILTQIYDYIRSTNLFDDTLEPQPWVSNNTSVGRQFTSPRNWTNTQKGHGQVAPIRNTANGTSGFGRYYSLSEAGLHFICTADAESDPLHLASNNVVDVPANPTGTPPTPAFFKNKTLDTKLTAGRKRIEMAFLTELFAANQGYTVLHSDFQIRVRGLQNIRINGNDPGFAADATIRINTNGTSLLHGRAWGGSGGFRIPLAYSVNMNTTTGELAANSTSGQRKVSRTGGPMVNDTNLNAMNVYPFVSRPFSIIGSSISLTGADNIIVDIYCGSETTIPQDETTRMQTIHLSFPNGTFPAPRLVTSGFTSTPATGQYTYTSVNTTKENWWTFSYDGAIAGYPGRIAFAGQNPGSAGSLSGAWMRAEDVIRTLVPKYGDHRLVAGRSEVPATAFEALQPYDSTTAYLSHNFGEAAGVSYFRRDQAVATSFGKLSASTAYAEGQNPDVPPTAGPVASLTGDWDTGLANYPDGPYINKPEEGNNRRVSGSIPYFDNNQEQEIGGPTFFSPNRQVTSPVMFGSLPSRVISGKPWQTLLFRPVEPAVLSLPTSPNPEEDMTYLGGKDPKDHLLLDLFWMPVVEPYAISEPFSTAGKINMNYQIVPFTYIERSTGLQALLKSEKVMAIPTSHGTKYKGGINVADPTYRREIDPEQTLLQFARRFNVDKDLFRSASEICDLYLVPIGQQLSNMGAFWKANDINAHNLTGDNARERPYGTLYPRLTTKSNSYTIHYRVQVLQQASRSRGTSAAAWATWNEASDQVMAESRGSTTIERYVDPTDTTIPDFADPALTAMPSLDNNYRFRVVNSKKFTP